MLSWVVLIGITWYNLKKNNNKSNGLQQCHVTITVNCRNDRNDGSHDVWCYGILFHMLIFAKHALVMTSNMMASVITIIGKGNMML